MKKKIKIKKPIIIGILVAVVLAIVGTVGALNGWFGGWSQGAGGYNDEGAGWLLGF